MAYYLFIFRRFWVKEFGRSESSSDENCYLCRSTGHFSFQRVWAEECRRAETVFDKKKKKRAHIPVVALVPDIIAITGRVFLFLIVIWSSPYT